MTAWEVTTDELGAVQVVNETDVPLTANEVRTAVVPALMSRPEVAQMARWVRNVQSSSRRGGLLDRDRYKMPATTLDQVRTARLALEDDIVDGVADLTEALAFKQVQFFARDEDEEDVWNQWAATVNLDGLVRSAWREFYTDSMIVFGVWWGRASYTPRGETETGKKRRKTYDLVVPTQIDTIDSTKIAPVGTMLFGRERLAYIATPAEAAAFDDVLEARSGMVPQGGPSMYRWGSLRWDDEDSLADDIVSRLIVGRYTPDIDERIILESHGVDCQNLFLMSSDAVFRHTATKGGYERYPRVRMKSAFEVLDLKHQLRQKDRVYLMAGINFIIIVKLGSDKQEALPNEISHLRANVQSIAQMPIMVGPHTLSVEIVTPKMEDVLSHDKWDTLDERLAQRLLRQFGRRQSSDKAGDVAQMIGHYLEAERKMIRRSLEAKVFKPIMDRNDSLSAVPKLRFHPGRIALAFDQAYAAFVMDLLETRNLSRGTALSMFEFDEADEAAMFEREAKNYDSTFKSLATPGAVPLPNPDGKGLRIAPPASVLPDPTDPRSGETPPATAPATRTDQRRAGRRLGGNRGGGGAAPGTGQGQAPRNPRKTAAELASELETLGVRELRVRARDAEIPGRGRMDKPALVDALVDVYVDDEEES